MKTITKAAIILAFSATTLLAITPEERGLEIATLADKANNGFKGEQTTSEMILINAHGDRITRKSTMKTREVADDGDQSIIEFSWPADVKGTRMLTWSHKTKDDDQWLYLPALKRTKRINSSTKTGSFMGSEFSYEDISSQEVEKYTYKYIKDDTLNTRKVWVIERYPVDPRSGYSKQIVYIDQEYMNPVQIDYFDRKNELLKTSYFKDYKKYGNFWRQNEIEVINRQTQKSSILKWDSRKLGETYPAKDFQQNSLLD